MLENYIHIHPEIQRAISFGYPVVALESYSIANTSTYPKNIEIINNICNIIRSNGAVPATIAIVNGVLKVGLTEEELDIVLMNNNISSSNINDLVFAISNNLTCTTKLAPSIKISNWSNINIIITNNINGLLKTKYNHIEITSDLQSLCCNEIFVICSEIESNIDINATLEYLNSNDVTILNQKTNTYKICSTSEIVKLLKIKNDLNINTGSLLLNSYPSSCEKLQYKCDVKQLYRSANTASKVAKELMLIYKK